MFRKYNFLRGRLLRCVVVCSLACFLKEFYARPRGAHQPSVSKRSWAFASITKFSGFSIPWLLCCWVDFLIHFWLIFGGCGCRKSTKNQPKINPKSDQKQDAILDASWMALGAILDGFWSQVGRIGAKLAPKSEEMGYQDDVKKSSKIWRCGGTQVVREWSASKFGPGP